MTDDLPIQFRQMREEDYPFILSSWLNSSFETSLEKALGFGDGSHRTHNQRIVLALLDRAVVTVAHPKDDEDSIIGWLCSQRSHVSDTNILHYAYVKSGFRGLGILKRLLLEINPMNNKMLVTHVGRHHQLMVEHGYPLVIDPHAVRDGMKGHRAK